MLDVADALVRVLDGLAPVGSETVSARDGVGRVAAVEIRATRPQPPYANSAMDGYAVCTTSLRGDPPFELDVVGESAAGRRDRPHMRAEEAYRIFTGAPLPVGADAVIVQEDVSDASGRLLANVAPEVGAHVRHAGEDIARGQLLIQPGQVLEPGEIANLLTQGVLALQVFRKPRVAFVSTGDELIEAGPEPAFGEITNSSVPMLAAAARQWGAETREYPPLVDDLDTIIEGFRAAARDTDLLVVTGGMSVGDYDFAAEAMNALGSVSFHKIRMKPGKPLAFGTIGEVPVLGLPGNPVSSYVGFELFGRPAIRKLAGHTKLLRPTVRAPLAQPFPRLRSRPNYIRGAFDREAFVPHARQGSGDLSSVLGVEGLAIIDVGEGEVPAGEAVTVIDLRAS